MFLQSNGKDGRPREIKVYRLLCPIRSHSYTNKGAPTGALDSSNSNNILHLFRELVDKFSISIIISTHDYHVAEVSDRQIKMLDGELYEA